MLNKQQEKNMNTYLNLFPLIGLIISIFTAIFTLTILDYKVNLDLILYIIFPFAIHTLIFIVVKLIKK